METRRYQDSRLYVYCHAIKEGFRTQGEQLRETYCVPMPVTFLLPAQARRAA